VIPTVRVLKQTGRLLSSFRSISISESSKDQIPFDWRSKDGPSAHMVLRHWLVAVCLRLA
jgi:hypothetical protein